MNEERRQFLKSTCGLCASLLGIGMVMPALQSCSSLMTIQTNVKTGGIDVPKVNFTPENQIVIIKNAPFEFDIAVVKLGEDNYKAFEMQCTHQANSLVPTKSGFYCNAHGSSFSLEGKVKNAPANRDLKQYPVEIASDKVTVKV